MAVTFLVVLVAAEIGARALEPRLPEPQVWDSLFLQDKAERIHELGDVDVAVIGSSIANASIDTSAIIDAVGWADSGYNASNPGSAPREWAAWDRDIVLPELCPDLVVIALGPRDTNDNEPNGTAEIADYLDSDGRRDLYGESKLGKKVEQFFQDTLALVAIRERLREPDNVRRYLSGEAVTGWEVRLTDDGRFPGFDTGQYRDDPERDRRLETGELRDYEVGPVQFGALERTIREAQATGAYVVLVDMPLMRSELRRIVDGGEADFLDYDRALAALSVRTGTPVLSYPDMNDTGAFYADFYHMTLLGTMEISARVGRDIAQLFPEPPSNFSCAQRPPFATSG
jgi:hypothetical protein